jgi:60S ribosome subunit biogenesis protein NIP7
MNQDNIPLGFGVLAKSAEELKQADPTSIYVFNQADLGEYLRIETIKRAA